MSDQNEGNKGLAAKDVSLKSMIIAAFWIGGLTIVKAIWGVFSPTEFGLKMDEILTSGLVIAGVFSPVYIAIVLDKIKDIKIGG